MARTRSMSDGLSLLCMVEEPYGVLAIVSSRCCQGIEQLAFPLDRRCLAILWDHVLKEFAPSLQSQSVFHVRLLMAIFCARHLCRHDRESLGCLSRNLTLETHYRGSLSLWRGEIGEVVGSLKTQH